MREIEQRISDDISLYSSYQSQWPSQNHVNLSEPNISNEITFVLQEDESNIFSSSQNRIKQQLLEHIYSGTDVILITSSQAESTSLFLQQCFDDNNDQIRTLSLNSDSFPKDDFETDNDNSAHDLSMISAVIYESIHLDTHFAIVVDGADQLPIQILNELIKLALAINSSKNNVNFIFSGGPGLLSVVQQISDITRLGLAHCSLDEITEQDIEVYIDGKQSECVESKKLKFNKHALKKISTYANANLHRASTLLEWCRIYAVHKGNYKVTVGFIDEVLSNPECNHLLSSYPTADFAFTTSVLSSNKDDNIEFSTQNDAPSKQAPIDESSRTVYIDEINTNNDENNLEQENVYEKVMADTTSEVITIDGTEIMNITLKEDDVPNQPTTTQETNADTGYQDTYQIEALKNINNPLSPTYADQDTSPAAPAQLAKASSNTNSSAFLWTFFILSIVIGSYYLFTTNNISYVDVRNFINNTTSINAANKSANLISATPNSNINTAPTNIDEAEENKRNIDALINLAESQIKQKKLSTPPSDNALDTYRIILNVDSKNNQALAGINLIKERYQTWAKLDIKDGNSKRAIYFLQRAIEIAPDEEAINLLSNLQ